MKSSTRSSKPREFPENYDDKIELNQGLGCCSFSLPLIANILFVGSIFSFLAYLVSYSMMAGAVSNANNSSIVKSTGDWG